MIAVPGQTPTLPVMTLEPVLVTVEPARTPKLPAVPRLMELALALTASNGKSKNERANQRRTQDFMFPTFQSFDQGRYEQFSHQWLCPKEGLVSLLASNP